MKRAKSVRPNAESDAPPPSGVRPTNGVDLVHAIDAISLAQATIAVAMHALRGGPLEGIEPELAETLLRGAWTPLQAALAKLEAYKDAAREVKP